MTETDAGRSLLERAAEALTACATSSLTVKPELDQPYPDHPGWTPYARWVERPADRATELAAEIRRHLETP